MYVCLACMLQRPQTLSLQRGSNVVTTRRRDALALLVRRFGNDASSRNDVVDVLFALTSFVIFEALARNGRSADAVCRLLQPLCDQAMTAIAAEPGPEVSMTLVHAPDKV